MPVNATPLLGSTSPVFLTGATGVLGANVLKELLKSTNAPVFCLVRAATADEGRARIASLLAAYDPESNLYGELEARVHPVLGDVSRPALGLSEADAALIADQASITIHVAANTNLFSNLRRIEPINLGGTERAIELALKTRDKRFLYVSTFTVMGDKNFDPTVVFREEHLDIGQAFPYMTYQQTKFHAEKRVRAAEARGLKWIITRPGQIFGEAETGLYPQGQTNVAGLFYDIFKTIIESKVALHVHAHYDVTPVDYISRAIVHLAGNSTAYGHTYHLTNPDIRSYAEVVSIVRELGYEMVSVPEPEYKRMLLNREIRVNGEEYKSNTISAFKWWFSREPFTFERSAITECDFTQSVLNPAGIACPPIDEKLIGTYLEGGVRLGYFPAPPSRSRRETAPVPRALYARGDNRVVTQEGISV